MNLQVGNVSSTNLARLSEYSVGFNGKCENFFEGQPS